MFDSSWPGWGLAQSAISAGAGLLGVFAGTLMTARGQANERKVGRIRDQLQSFYSPMLGMRSEIDAKSQTRRKVGFIAETTWHEEQLSVPDRESKNQILRAGVPTFQKLKEYDNAQLCDELIPIYRKMLKHFTEHMWLAEPSTRGHYDAFAEHVEIWNRHLKGFTGT